MLYFLSSILKIILHLFKSRKKLLLMIAIIEKENDILHDFRRHGKIRKALTWRRFMKMHINTIYALDFFTVDTIFRRRFYIMFIVSHKTREIIHFAITANPLKEFVRQQIIEFVDLVKGCVYFIHDNAAQFAIDYASFGIKEARTSARAPDMNAVAERFVGSARREALDYFIIGY